MIGNIDTMPHWAEESVGQVKELKPAAIVAELAGEAENLLRK
jgi:hypothetical protein